MLQNPNSFFNWLMQIAANKCRNFIKANRPVPVEDETLEGFMAEDNEFFLPEEYVTDMERRQIVMSIMQNYLSDVQYQTVLMYYFNNMTIPEIAAAMECPEGTVKYRLSVARGKIKAGVMQYEQINDTRLYSFAGVPLLALLLAEEAKGYYVPQAAAGIVSAIYGAAGVGVAGAISDGAGAQMTGGAAMGFSGEAAAGKTGGIFASLGAKIAIGVAVVAVIGGIVAAVIINHKNDDKDKTSTDTQYALEDDNGNSDSYDDAGNGNSDTDYAGGIITKDNKAAYTEDMRGYIDDNGNYVNDYFGFTTYYAGQGWDLELYEDYYFRSFGVEKAFVDAMESEAPQALWAQHWDDGAMDRGDAYYNCYDLLHNMDEVEATDEWYKEYMLNQLSSFREAHSDCKYSLYSALIDGTPCYYIELESHVEPAQGEILYGAPHHQALVYVFKDNMYMKISIYPSYCPYNYEEVFANQLKIFNMSDFVPIDIDDIEKQNEADKLTGSNVQSDASADNEDQTGTDLYYDMIGYLTDDGIYKNDYYGIEVKLENGIWDMKDWHMNFADGYTPTDSDFEAAFTRGMPILMSGSYGQGTDYDYGEINAYITDLSKEPLYEGEDITSDELHEKDFRMYVDRRIADTDSSYIGYWMDGRSVLYIGTISCGNMSGWYYINEFGFDNSDKRMRNEAVILYKDNIKIQIDILPSSNSPAADTQIFYDRLTTMENRINFTDRVETEVIDSRTEE
ncbi:MAG: sigma-70 family RNA polymerase sigma factor [Lachnospiraceae bacterium]|nr:sigma-70 family RNA polymerase sigma factor [Lachnospiraceae bacterium]